MPSPKPVRQCSEPSTQLQKSGAGGSKEQLAADLVWAVTTPSLVVGDEEEGVGDLWELEPARVDADHLADWIGTPKRRVGLYFEQLIEYWLSEIRGCEIEGTGVQLKDPETGRTLGELDFVYRDETGRRTHLETAVKFYLHSPAPGASHFPGPNASDNFEAKMELFFDHQLTRSEGLGPNGARCFDRRIGLVRGICFDHPEIGAPAMLPSRMSPTALTGTWIRGNELELIEQIGSSFMVMAKPHWLGRPVGEPLSVAEFVDRMRVHFASGQRTIMAAVIDGCGGGEIDRLCIVAPSWRSGRIPI